MTATKHAAWLSISLGLVALALVATGCSSEEPAAYKLTPKDEATIQTTLASLPAEDRELATKQKMCPVGDEPLGLMGKPVKAEIKGQVVFLCCEGCKKVLLEDPDKYLAELGLEPSTE